MLARWREEGAEGGEVREEKQAQVEVPTAARSNAVGRKNNRMHFFVPSSLFCSPIYFAMRQKDAVVPIAGRKIDFQAAREAE